VTTSGAAIARFWEDAQRALGRRLVPYFGGLTTPLQPSAPPQAWAFGGTPAQADELLGLVLAGMKTATAGALWDYEAAGEPVPADGDLSIVLDGDGRPRALLRTTDVRVVPFEEVDAEHARLEGEGDLSLDFWRRAHESFFTEYAAHDRGFDPTMPVVLERFEMLYSA